MISIVIISKDEEGLEGTLRGVARQAQDLPDPCEIVVVDVFRAGWTISGTSTGKYGGWRTDSHRACVFPFLTSGTSECGPREARLSCSRTQAATRSESGWCAS